MLVALPAAEEPPEPVRPLGSVGRALWDHTWGSPARHWVSPDTDAEAVQCLCELADERQGLRVRVLRDGEWRERNQLRAIDQQIMSYLSLLGLNPTARARLGVAEVRQKDGSVIDDLLARRQNR